MTVETWMAVFSCVVAVSTVAYAILTWKLFSETRQMREAQTEPRVSIRLEMNHTGLHGYELVIRNEGQGVARNVRFEFEGDSSYFRESFIRGVLPTVDQLPIITDGLPYLESGQVFRFSLGMVSEEEFNRAAGDPWIFRVRYENLYGKEKKDTYTLDFSQFRGMFFAPNRLVEISQHLDSIRKDLNRLTEGYTKIQVVNHKGKHSQSE